MVSLPYSSKACARITKVDWGYSISLSIGCGVYEKLWWRPTEKWALKTAKRLVDSENRRLERVRNPVRID